MKNFILLFFLIISITSFSQYITRGPDVGEIYFLGPSGLYYSTDFGETATFIDGSMDYVSIAADKTQGGVYCIEYPSNLYYNDNFGYVGFWEFKSSNSYLSYYIASGVTEGYLYSDCYMHSEDYGSNFTIHQLNNYFGYYMESEIGYDDKGYIMTYEVGGNDTLYFFVSYDNFENLELIYKFNVWGYGLYDLSYGHSNGDLYFYNSINKDLFYSANDGYNWIKKNTFTCPNLPIQGITGGSQDGELYMLVEYVQMFGDRKHIYIYHSLDNGETFTVHHPVSIGLDPVVANFIAEDTLVEPGDSVQFIDQSNEAEYWEWDFNNDEIIDSYDQHPAWVYQDTGYYSVKLKIQSIVIEDYAIRYDYIHVDDLTNTNVIKRKKDEISIYPNPVNNNLNITFNQKPHEIFEFLLFNSSGELIKAFNFNDDVYSRNSISIPVSELQEGVYFVKVSTQLETQTKKIIITH